MSDSDSQGNGNNTALALKSSTLQLTNHPDKADLDIKPGFLVAPSMGLGFTVT